MKMYRFIVTRKFDNCIIDTTENLTETQINDRIDYFLNNGYNQIADYRIEVM